MLDIRGAASRLRYFLQARRCECKGHPRRFAGGAVQVDGVLHRPGGPCYPCDTYGRRVTDPEAADRG